jgi:hypothetical protein
VYFGRSRFHRMDEPGVVILVVDDGFDQRVWDFYSVGSALSIRGYH